MPLYGLCGYFYASNTGSTINPRLTQRLDAWHSYQANGGTLSMRGWVKQTQGASWGTGFKSGYSKWINSIESVHGNSLNSLKPTWGYKLYSNDGTFFKNGITSQIMAEKRYTKAFMEDKYMETMKFPNRRTAYDWEAMENIANPGPLNLNKH